MYSVERVQHFISNYFDDDVYIIGIRDVTRIKPNNGTFNADEFDRAKESLTVL